MWSNRNKNVQFYNILYDGMNRLTRIVADNLQNDEVSSLVEYMTAMSSGQLTQHKKIIEVTGLTNKKIKFLLHKFLYTRHLPRLWSPRYSGKLRDSTSKTREEAERTA